MVAAPRLPRPRGDGGALRRVGGAQDAGGVGGGVGRSLLGIGQGLGQVLLALSQGMGVRGDGGHVRQADARPSHEVQVVDQASEADFIVHGNGEAWVKGHIAADPQRGS